MNVLNAAQQTMALAHPHKAKFPKEGAMSYDHIHDMYVRMDLHTSVMSYGKMCRWLGWMQCAVYAAGIASLEDMKNINKANKDG